ncbi:MAG: response regulator transcription factor, partial [Caulobacteraceae bacterium]
MSDGVIHVVDDDDAVRDSLSFLFESSGFAVETYASGSDALERMAPRAADCIVTDVRMPGMSGLDLLRNLREKGLATPVIVITGHGDVPLAVEAMRSGAADFIEKPFEEEALLASVRRALGATQQAPSGGGAGRPARR